MKVIMKKIVNKMLYIIAGMLFILGILMETGVDLRARV